MTETLIKIIRFAAESHGSQKYGSLPYIVHPIEVMLTGRKLFGEAWTENHDYVAILHDVKEDTSADTNEVFEIMRYDSFNSIDVLIAITILTKDKDIPYDVYITSITYSSDMAIMVKYADLMVNSTGDKSHMSPERREKLNAKYSHSIEVIEDALKNRGIEYDANH